VSLRDLVAFLFPHRWRGHLAEAKRLLGSEHPSLNGIGEKIEAWLTSPAWEVRNAAVKLIAHIHDHGRYRRLIDKLTDPSEAGIVRRNAAEAMARLGLSTHPVRAALLRALSDPYWEVRAEAVRSVAALFAPAEDLERALLGLLYGPRRNARRRVREDNFEVRMACARGLGHLGTSRDAYDALATLAHDDSWLVRSQAAVALAHFAARQPDYFDDTREHVRHVDRLSEGAISYFVHRDTLSHVLRALRKGPADMAADALRTLYLSPKAGWNHVRR
jgi:UDP-N-acetylglucosamine--N-acetylmuramyl-(pentapeptide) pyrophosphoryl-undecaprenol N-acetylglucosamine transferase